MISDEELDKIRSKASYRAAIWLVRLNSIPVGAFFWFGLVRRTESEPRWFLPLWLLLTASTVTMLLLLHRSGVPFRGTGPFQRVRDPRVVRQIQKDVFWFRRP